MKKGEVTIHDIARELNISGSTVSRALRDHPEISEDTRKLVKEVAKRMGYRPNAIASSLRNSKTNIIGVIVPRMSSHFFSSAISGIQDIAHENGYNVIISQSNENYDREVIDAQILYSTRVDGVIASLSLQTINVDHFKLFKERNVPLVFFDRVSSEIDTDKVIADDYNGALKATEHLILNGCKRIAHIGGPRHINIYADKWQGYLAALRKYNLNIDNNLIIQSNLSREDGLKATISLLSLPEPPDAIFAASDQAAIAALQYAKGVGIKVPKDLAIVGYSNDPTTSVIEPAITTIDQSAFEMGQTTAELLIKQINQLKTTTYKNETIVIPVRLVERKSSIRL